LEEKIIKNIKQKVVRNIELKSDPKGKPATNIVQYITNDRNVAKYKHTVNDSELLRVIEAIDKNHVYAEVYGNRKLTYIEGLISVHIGYSVPKYNTVKENDGILILEHYQWIEDGKDEKTGQPKSKLVQCFEDENENTPKQEKFKRLIVGSGHSRGKKALFIREDLFDSVNKILLGGIDELSEENYYPLYDKGYAKWSAYYGLVSTDSKAVKDTPKIVVVDDFEREAEDVFDVVVQTKSFTIPKRECGQNEKNKYTKDYGVEVKRKYVKKILPFDGAGLVSVGCATRWAEDLELKNGCGKRYIPAAFQFRAIPGIKGNLYTFDIMDFAKNNGWIITDINGKTYDLREESVDIILTKSQVKFLALFDDDISKWRELFDEEIKGEDKTWKYKRTFNISEYSEDSCDLKSKMLTAYQHLQTVQNTSDEIESMTKDTIDMLKKISCDVNEFLKYRSCTADEENSSTKKEWSRIPPYYRAAYYAAKENKPIIFADNYFKNKVKEDIKGAVNRALAGKLYITGNYQVLTPDIYALAQYAFGKRGSEVTGLLKSGEIYSAWWIAQNYSAWWVGQISKMSNKKDNPFACEKLALIRNPHIYMEARIARMVSAKDEQQYEAIRKWFRYQTTGIVTDSFSTIPLALGTADFDGDHIAATNCKEYIDAVERARADGDGNTIDVEFVYSTAQDNTDKKEAADVGDIKKLMEFDALAFQNNIGSVIDRVTMLWGAVDEKPNKNKTEIRKYIRIMDIIGQLTIDAAKTGEFEAIPSDIKKLIKTENMLTPYFMKYLQKNERKKKKEKVAKENAVIFLSDDKTTAAERQEIEKKQARFSDVDCNLNRICKHMEQKVKAIQVEQVEIDESKFDVEQFLPIFITEKPNENSKLYIKLRAVLKKLTIEHRSLHKGLMLDDADKKREDKEKYYNYFYAYARNELLQVCKLLQEKSISKVLNCIVHICYIEPEIIDNDGAKNIMWNCFEEELVERAKRTFIDKQINYSGISKRVEKTRDLKKKKLAAYTKKQYVNMKELDEAGNPIIIRDDEINQINFMISEETLKGCGIDNNKVEERVKELKKLYAVLMVISKRLENKKTIGEGEEKKEYHCINPITIRQNGNNRINYSNIAKLCGYSDYQRKKIKEQLADLDKLDAINITTHDMSSLKIKVIYDKIEDTKTESLVDSEDYIKACEQTLLKLH